VAVNLAGVHHSEVHRGDVLAPPGALRPTTLLDVRLRVLADAPAHLVQNMPLDLFTGASEVRCRLTLLDAERLEPGAAGWAQLRLEQPVTVLRGDRCILRVASPSRTVAGGSVVDTHPPRHRRFRPEVMAALETLARGDPAELLLQALGDGPPRPWEEVAVAAGMAASVARPLAEQLAAAERLVAFDGLLVAPVGWAKLVERLPPTLRAYHARFPLRRGIPREELRQKLRLTPRALGPFVEEALRRGLVGRDETSVWAPEHSPQPAPAERRALDAALAAMARAPYGPPAPDLDGELLAWALDRRLFVRVTPEVYFLPQTYDELLAWVRATIGAEGSVSVGGMRDRFGSSRKYALAFLEHLDERKITRREGEGRVLA
jgi:selenocysteine-specific elongation factor